MIQGDFHGSVGPESVGFSECQFRFVVESLNRACRGRPLGAEPIEQQGPMGRQRASDWSAPRTLDQSYVRFSSI